MSFLFHNHKNPFFSLYHVPVIPLLIEDENFLMNLGEQLNKVDLVFEHHKHNFKRTKQIQVIKSDGRLKVYPGNTYYVGNGAMGVQSAHQVDHQIIEKSNRQAHFWVYNYSQFHLHSIFHFVLIYICLWNIQLNNSSL